MKTMEEQIYNKINQVETKTDTATASSEIAFVVLAEAGQIDDVTASEHIEAFEAWAYPVKYKVGQLRQYNGALYRCIQEHTSQADWPPDAVVSLWVPTSDPAEEFPDWSQPIGKNDAYKLGAKVTHNGKKWVCSATDAAGNNVWEPGVYGWTEYVEEV